MPTRKVWKFQKRKEAVKKLKTLKDPELYHIRMNRAADGKFLGGWVLEKLN